LNVFVAAFCCVMGTCNKRRSYVY